VIRRLFFIAFIVLGGWLLYIPKWILVGTKAGRERKAILRELKRANAQRG
jgi:hypothetical protein